MAISETDIREQITELLSELDSLPRNERGRVQDFVYSLKEEAQSLAFLERDAEQLPDNPGLSSPLQARLDALLRRLNGMVATASVIGQELSRESKVLLGRAWQGFITLMMSALSSMAKKLNIQNWSVGITGGFPAGISGTITITFAP